ncbi:hypothetical protein AAFF_G00256330 [Aldrovandia affinis]|uniref:C2H2-type domain-containing protein n=1 Tax=Aldrovandia affinis TaxID=143900 RepID=A0AAD7RC96_9TELE|nr:hypothetical protein AAFF_G00256330 [Aldrovandia affinis]
MADKEDERNMKSETEKVGCYRAAQLHGVVGLTRSGYPVVLPHVSENKHDVSDDCEELTLVVKDETETAVISEYLRGSIQEGASLAQSCPVGSPFTGEGLLSERIITSFVETPAIETVTTADLSTVTSELVDSVSPTTTTTTTTTTIIYVQPDGSFVEGTGLTAEEQRQLVEQLAKQQLVEVTENEAARIFEQQRAPPSHYIHSGALAPSELQQVIDQVSKSQQSAGQVEQHGVAASAQPTACISFQPGCLFTTGSPVQDVAAQPLCIMQNAAQQLQHVAKQVALQQSQSLNGTRLVHKKQLETIRIQVQIPPPPAGGHATPCTPLSIGLAPKVGVSGGAPQIIHIAPVIGQQQYLLTNPGDPPIQLLLQRPAPPGGPPLLHKLALHTPVNGKASRPAPAPPPERRERQREKHKAKRPQKVQTRSGRVSRPPKHKVKDYKFIKTEDLVDGRQSDSDDYSEISMEEEGEGAGGRKPSLVSVYLNAKSFKCKSCEKAYIGLGGLTRHYRLNPAHGEAEPAAPATPTAPSTFSAPSGRSAPAPIKAVQTADNTSASTNQITENITEPVPMVTSDPALQPVQEGKAMAPPGQGATPSGPARPRGPGRPGRPRSEAHSARRGRPGRPPKNPAVLQQPQRRARLKEVLQVCDDEDLMEVVLPRLARVMTLWEFLLMKVDKGRPSRPQFSDVYREFEQLHTQVKKMAQDHFSAPPGPGAPATLEVQDPQVCQLLGIGDHVTRLKPLPSDPLQQKPAGVPEHSQLGENTGQREHCTPLPPAKRFKPNKSTGETNGAYLIQNGTAVPAAGTGAESGVEDRCLATTLPDPGSVSALGYQTVELSLHPQTAPLEFTTLEAEFSPEELVQDHLGNLTETVSHAPDPVPEAAQESIAEPGEELNDGHCRSDAAAGTSSELRYMEQVVSLGDTVEFQLADSDCSQEQVFIQTEEGLILHQPGGGSERLVIVTSPDGTTMHIRTPDTVPLETVQALLGIDTGTQPEGVLVSENHP